MPSTTERPVCEWCGAPLKAREWPDGLAFTPPTVYAECSCDGAARAREERERREAAERRRRDEREFRERLARAGVKPRYMHAEHELARDLAKRVADGESLYLWGAFGTGKTHLASAIARRLVWAGKSVRMLTGIDLTMQLQATYGSRESEADAMGAFARCGVLVMDDLGKEPPSDWALSRLFAVVNARYDALRPVIVTTNYERGSLVERMGKRGDHDTAEALVSRLCEMGRSIKLEGGDRRLA